MNRLQNVENNNTWNQSIKMFHCCDPFIDQQNKKKIFSSFGILAAVKCSANMLFTLSTWCALVRANALICNFASYNSTWNTNTKLELRPASAFGQMDCFQLANINNNSNAKANQPNLNRNPIRIFRYLIVYFSRRRV